ncbi:hypothetical protein [Tenacibaculum jejuense]|uniref:Uncharacterized protein n=1 Tax=Tenacibaculum jejuense TaxID=584609 RepID=A0A238UC50_9FLAO|nr:hypothetical protein [Tenacibaculum jejuense]SNR16751.1 conserved protein of unknown function [Tenacibaculum jejuense]
MKNTIKLTLIITILLSVFNTVYAQKKVKDTIVIGKEYARSRKLPITVNKGTVIINQIDSLHLVNQIRFHYYEELRKELFKNDFGKDIENIVLKYERIVEENNELFDQLEQKSKAQSDLFKKTISELKKSLDETDRTLNLTQKSLDNANTSIELSMRQIESAQRRQFWKNFGFIGGGIGMGLLLGLLIAN